MTDAPIYQSNQGLETVFMMRKKGIKLASALVALMFAPGISTASASVLNLHIQGTVNSTIPNTSITAGDSVNLRGYLDTSISGTLSFSTTFTFQGAFQASQFSLSGVDLLANGSSTFTGVSTSDYATSDTLRIQPGVKVALPPFDGAGALASVTFSFNDPLIVGDGTLNSITAATLLGADTISGSVNVLGGNGSSVSITQLSISAVPLPATLPLIGTGLGLLCLFGCWRRRGTVAG